MSLRTWSVILVGMTVGLSACRMQPDNGGLLDGVTADNHRWFPIKEGAHAMGRVYTDAPNPDVTVSCSSCHDSTAESFTSFTCLNCHGHPQNIMDTLHGSGGTGLYRFESGRCYQCHQDGARVNPFLHAAISTVQPTNCALCHQPDALWSRLPTTELDHSTITPLPSAGGPDCGACHVTATWEGATRAPNGVFDPGRNVILSSLIPTYMGTEITAVTPRTLTLTMPMDHSVLSDAVLDNCATCHAQAASGTLRGGDFHASLRNAMPALEQPTTCNACHSVSASMPVGFVGPIANNPAREPASGEMKHDAVLWNGAAPTATAATPTDCNLCHQAPSAAGHGWAFAPDGTSPAQFHGPLTTAGIPQPGSCVDCHANSRPNVVLSSANATLPAGANWSFEHTLAVTKQDCMTCHNTAGPTLYTSWSGGKFHLNGAATPASCLPCHGGDRPTSTATWQSPTYADAPFDYTLNSLGKGHGADMDCVTCHTGPGTGAWGGTQNWMAGNFVHDTAGSPAAVGCRDCHTTQRPDLVLGAAAAAALFNPSFDHAVSGRGDCKGCHDATVVMNTYAHYFNPSTGMLPGGDWQGGTNTPNDAFDPAHTIQVPALIPTYQGAEIATLTPLLEVLTMTMNHQSPQVPAAMRMDCAACHAGAATGNFLPGTLHSALQTTGNPQPTTCAECHHAQSTRPTGFVGPLATAPARVPESGEMKHDAVEWANNAPGTTPAVPADCAACHRVPGATAGVTWSQALDGTTPARFHGALVSAALPQPVTCVDCHANSRPNGVLDSTNATLPPNANWVFDHGATITKQDCAACHGGNAGARYTSWAGGRFHLAGATAPSTCLPCHETERPTSTANWQSPTWQDAPFDYVPNAASITHGAGLDCVTCHANPGRGAWGSTQDWAAGHFDHDPVGSIAAEGCISCHSTQRPDLLPNLTAASAAALLGGFDHAVSGAGDCRGCHLATVTRGIYLDLNDANTGMFPGGDWRGGSNAPTDAYDFTHDVNVVGLMPGWSATSITSLTSNPQALHMNMHHASSQFPAAFGAACANCHVDAALGVYYPGYLHSSLTDAALPQPALCNECHFAADPVGFVGPTATAPARTPPSGEMRHDAVAWSNSLRTTQPLVTQDCAVCHVSPDMAGETWDMDRNQGVPARYHAALNTALVAQPGSCLDCHANSRPTGVLSGAGAMLPAGVTFDHGSPAALGDCQRCHAPSGPAFTAWTGGRFHLVGSVSPTTCLPCHDGERPTSSAGWTSTTYQLTPFDYGTNANGVTHGAGQDCVTCHTGPGTGGAWGGTQTWVGGRFIHGPNTLSATACTTCHTTQRPDISRPGGRSVAQIATLLNFDHAVNGAGDCLGCHSATVNAGRYVSYLNASNDLPGGDWQGGTAYPGSNLVSDPAESVTVTEISLVRSAPNNLVRSTTQVTMTYPGAMLHTSPAIPAQVFPGATANPDFNTCWHCHTNTNGNVTSYVNGWFHNALTTYRPSPGAPVQALAQPTTRCGDCHVQMRPANIVQKNNAALIPMDHGALFTGTVVISGASVSGVGQMACSSCHSAPGNTWADGQFHPRIGAAVPQDCTVCHYNLMANAASSDKVSAGNYAMKHASTQMTFQNCRTCHTNALSASATNNLTAPAWSPGTLHPSMTIQPTQCVDCHGAATAAAGGSRPTASTQSTRTYTLALGGTATNGAQWMNHASSAVGGRDCAACHAADARVSGSAWSKSSPFHAVVPNPTSCQECHGLTNGNGATPGTRNNMPAGLTNSSTTTTAVGATTGVPAGTKDQIDHADINVTGHDCRFCHTQIGPSSVPAIQGKEWQQASFHSHFTGGVNLVLNGTTGRCSNCHVNAKPGPVFTAMDHAPYTAMSAQDCAACHSWPGTSPTTPNWQGATGAHAGSGPTAASTLDCNTCHGQNGNSSKHLAVPAANHYGGVSNGNKCTTCHIDFTAFKDTIAVLKYPHTNATANAGGCVTCHAFSNNLYTTLTVTPPLTRPTQAGGHQFSQTQSVTGTVSLDTGPPSGRFTSDHANAGLTRCGACHQYATTTATTNVWPFKHRPTNPGITNSRTTSGCTMCH